MKKLAIFLSCAASACVFNTASAQSSVTLYGVIDNGLAYQSTNAGAAYRAVPGGLYSTRYGFKGSEDIGGGLKINFQLEQAFSGMTGAATNPAEAFNRQAWVGMSGGFGEVRFGLQNSPQYDVLQAAMDPTAVKSIASPMNNFNSLTIRESNAISYFTPTFDGFSAKFMVAMRDSTTKPTNGLLFYNAVVQYVKGPFSGAAGYEQAANATGTSILKLFNAGASIATGPNRFWLAYHTELQTNTLKDSKRDVYQVSDSYLFSPTDQLSLMYGYVHDRTGAGNNAQELGLIDEYFLSKATEVYAALGFIQNRNRAGYTLNGTAYSGIAVVPGADTRGINLGIVHKF
ncbi:porin [Caballeronia sp. SEWSISQ10-4 2]|uniref:porin n=1 Tax=Caballeronia sp. SEWSISQ10-4 2 TaxID=2937438 RepID=UPI00264FEAA9|nr:porin [Caballeronia sp. SEWSISQ10-4 2]MDN7179481.1 porin [Caballeronia sp. SEWSISQ10-4 2]